MPPVFRRAVALLLLFGFALQSPAAERPPIADFARTPILGQARLSPDGQSLAYLREYGGRTHLCVLDLRDGQTVRFKIGNVSWQGAPIPKEVGKFEWVSDQRLLITTTVWDRIYGTAAVDRDGQNWRGLTGYEFDQFGQYATLAIEPIHIFDDESGRVLMLDRNDGKGAVRNHPEVLEVDTVTGLSKTMLENPGNVIGWMSDHEGVVRIGTVRSAEKNGVIYRENAQAPWRTLDLPVRGHAKLNAYAFDPDRETFYVTGFNDADRWSIFTYDLRTGTLGDAIISDPVYDAAGNGGYNVYAGVDLTRPIFSQQKQALIGLAHVAEFPRIQWLDPEFAKIQSAVDQALKGRVNLLVNPSRDDQRLLFFSFSDRDPGSFHLLDRRAKTFKPLGARMDWLDPEAMSPSYSINYKARDGTRIYGYLTVPAGHDAKGLPLVVMPHGGPWVRDNWGFDPLVQLIASRGYAVLQMNYRGSKGYGSAFEILGKKQIGRGIQDDIEDATRWAIKAKVADPERIAIVGASYGGFSALFALGKTPDLYRCGISLSGVTDWDAIFNRAQKNIDLRAARQFWIDRIGDPDEEPNFLRSISPVRFAKDIKASVLLIQGKDDHNVPPAQATDMDKALQKAGNPATMLLLKNTGHSLNNEPARLEAFETIVSFLEQHLGPGVPYQNPPN